MPSEILPGIWLGYDNDIYNEKFINNKKIKGILSNVKLKKNINTEFIYIPINNESQLNTLFIDYIYDFLLYIHKNYINYKNIMIYCKTGEQLSPGIMAAFLIKYAKITPNLAINIIKSKSNKAFVDNCTLIPSLINIYNKLNK